MAKNDKRKQVQIEAFELDISELEFDPENANRGTERGEYMLGESVQKHGIGRGIAVDKNFVIVAGNKTAAKAGETETARRVLVIPTDGRTLVATMRPDWDITENDGNNPAREYAFGDNRVGQVNLSFDPVAVVDAVDRGVDLGHLWFEDELAEIRAAIADGVDFDAFDESGDDDNVAYRVIVDGLSRAEADELSANLPDSRVEQYRMTL